MKSRIPTILAAGQVPCGKALHTIELMSDLSLSLQHHDDDPLAVQAFAALGGALPPCWRAWQHWQGLACEFEIPTHPARHNDGAFWHEILATYDHSDLGHAFPHHTIEWRGTLSTPTLSLEYIQSRDEWHVNFLATSWTNDLHYRHLAIIDKHLILRRLATHRDWIDDGIPGTVIIPTQVSTKHLVLTARVMLDHHPPVIASLAVIYAPRVRSTSNYPFMTSRVMIWLDDEES